MSFRRNKETGAIEIDPSRFVLLWRVCLMVLIAVMGWALTQIYEVKGQCATRQEVRTTINRIEQKIDSTSYRLEQKIDRISDYIICKDGKQ